MGRPESLPPACLPSPQPPPRAPPSSPQHQKAIPAASISFGEPGQGGHDPPCPPKPRTFYLCGCPPLPATWPSQRPVGSEAGEGLGSANGSPLPAILLPCLSHLCPPPPSPSITIPPPGPGESDGGRRPPPRGGGGASGRRLARGSEWVSPPPPILVLQLPRPPPRRRAAHGWRRELQRCVCV